MNQTYLMQYDVDEKTEKLLFRPENCIIILKVFPFSVPGKLHIFDFENYPAKNSFSILK